MSKEATVYLLDMNPSMAMESESKNSPFQTSKLILQKILLEKLISGRKGEQIGIVLVGSDESCNRQLDERSDDEVEAGAYEGILDLNFSKYSSMLSESSTKKSDLDSQLQAASSPLQMASMEMMKFLQNLKQSAQGSGDFMDAIVIAIKMLVAHCTSKSTGKPLKYAKKICIFTNGSGDGVSSFPTWCPDLIEPVIDQLRMNEITTLVCGFDFEIDADIKFEDKSPRSLLTQFVNRSDNLGHFITGQDAFQSIYDTNSKSSVRPTTTFRGDLTYGNPAENGEYALNIPIYVFVKTKTAAIPSSKKAFYPSSSDVEKKYLETSEVARDTAYYKTNQSNEDDMTGNESDQGEQVDREELVRGYRYGKHIVPFTDADEIASSLKTEKCMDIICFTPSTKIPRYCYMSNVLAIVPDPSSKVAAEKLASLSAAMQVKDHVAIVRYCRTEDAAPKLGVLSSNAKGYLYFNQIPFAEDIRNWTFRPFDFLANEVVNSKSGCTSQTLAKKRRIEQISSNRKHVMDARKVSKSKAMEAIDSLIDALDYSGQYDRLWPKKIGNIGLEKVYSAIMKKALGDGFHGFGDNDSITLPMNNLNNLDDVYAGLENAFELFVVPEKIHKGRVRRVAASSTNMEKITKEDEIEFSFLDEDDDVSKNAETEKNATTEDMDKKFDFLDF